MLLGITSQFSSYLKVFAFKAQCIIQNPFILVIKLSTIFHSIILDVCVCVRARARERERERERERDILVSHIICIHYVTQKVKYSFIFIIYFII